MSEINPLGSSFYFSGLQNAANRAAKNEKKEKISSSKVKFSDILKNSEVSEFELQGFPSEIANLSICITDVYRNWLTALARAA